MRLLVLGLFALLLKTTDSTLSALMRKEEEDTRDGILAQSTAIKASAPEDSVGNSHFVKASKLSNYDINQAPSAISTE
ncbi:hypothetical protein PRIPAC_90003 [Pristionchus pacificus]|uniref:Uncharacterized protein n=1 Tax=Pristionchus pacificus TaxID=54126 RepID=A0A2A6B9P3_PRIPA|nr:hypothetical protein PRIPAC_90003 [Pristionchus pacificus]|eukprot:PDM62584.1 hypothetical protein PRIPAC_52026 [Pristionchus pacificus]